MAAVTVILFGFGALFFASVIGALTGALCGYTVSIVFGDTILHVLAAFGVHGLKVWELGCFLGFVGGFFRSSVTQNNSK